MHITINRDINRSGRRVFFAADGLAILTHKEARKILSVLRDFVDKPPKLTLGVFKSVICGDIVHNLRMHFCEDYVDVTLGSRDLNYKLDFKIKRVDIDELCNVWWYKKPDLITVSENGGIKYKNQCEGEEYENQ